MLAELKYSLFSNKKQKDSRIYLIITKIKCLERYKIINKRGQANLKQKIVSANSTIGQMCIKNTKKS